MINMTMTEASKLLRLRKFQIRAEAHLEAGIKSGNRSLTRHAANMVEVLESRLTDAAFASIEPYSDFH